MTLLHFLVTFIAMVLFSCPAIVGWYIITRGEWYLYPDGTWRKYGMIFKDWSLLWEQYRKTKTVFYRGEPLISKYKLLQKVRPDLGQRLKIVKDSYLESDRPFTEADLSGVKDSLGCEIFETNHATRLNLCTEEPIYIFPSWVRKPLSECPTCMASTYGSIIYWFVVLNGPSGFFAWAVKENLAKFGFWVIFCLILACGNKFLEQKMKL